MLSKLKCVKNHNDDLDRFQKLFRSKAWNEIKDSEDSGFTCSNIDYKNYVHVQEVSDLATGLSVGTLNVRSMLKNENKVKDFLQVSNFDVVAVQETWQSESKFSDYEYIHTSRDKKRGGGVGFLVKKSITFKPLNTLMKPDIEVTGIRVGDTDLWSTYLPPRAIVSNGLNTLEEVVDKKRTSFVLGDLNIDMNKDSFSNSEASATERLHDFCRSTTMYPLIRNPTRVTEKSATTIDHIITNDTRNIVSGVMTVDVADHLCPFVIIKNNTKGPQAPKVKTTRNLKPANVAKLKEGLSKVDWETELKDLDCHQQAEAFGKIVLREMDIHCPEKTRKINKNADALEPWMTRGLLQSRVTKNILYNKWIKSRDLRDFHHYKDFKKVYDQLRKQCHKEHCLELYEQNVKDARKMWRITNDLLQRNKKGGKGDKKVTFIHQGSAISNNIEIANAFNQHFVSIGESLVNNFKRSEDYKGFLPADFVGTFSFREVNPAYVANIIGHMKNKGSSGFDAMSNILLKQLRDVVVMPLTSIINRSLREGKVPSVWKVAKVIPLFKGGDETSFNNYRPISLLSVYSKVLEKVVHKQFYRYAEDKILTQFQFGFRVKHETV